MIDIHQRQAVGDFEPQVDPAGLQMRFANRDGIPDHAVDLLPAAGRGRSAGERHQVANDAGGAIGVVANRGELFGLGGRGTGRQHQLGVAQHTLQRVVQFVRHARDQLPHRGQLLVLHQLLARRDQFLSGLQQRPPREELADHDDEAERDHGRQREPGAQQLGRLGHVEQAAGNLVDGGNRHQQGDREQRDHRQSRQGRRLFGRFEQPLVVADGRRQAHEHVGQDPG